MGWFNSNKNDKLKWLRIEDDLSYKDAIQSSYEEVILIFKHSTRCSISSMALNRMEDTENKTIDRCYYLDLLSFREISNRIESDFNVKHQSPQILVIKNGKCIFHTSHSNISWSAIDILN
jgi:bacillithiol system protein YtxJ